jgi:hypothetical protein
MQSVWFYQGWFFWQKSSMGEPVKKTSDNSSMGDYQNPLTLQATGSIHQCLTAPLKDLQTTLTLKRTELPSHFFLCSEFVHPEKLAKVQTCPATPVLLSQSGFFGAREVQMQVYQGAR